MFCPLSRNPGCASGSLLLEGTHNSSHSPQKTRAASVDPVKQGLRHCAELRSFADGQAVHSAPRSLCSSWEVKVKMRKVLPILTLLLFAVAVALPLSAPQPVEGQTATEALTTDMDAKTDDLFNGFGVKGTPIDECVAEPEPPTARGNGTFEDNKFIFSERETIEDGLGPICTRA